MSVTARNPMLTKLCVHCKHSETMHYDYGYTPGRNRGCTADNWAWSGVHYCGCPGFEVE